MGGLDNEPQDSRFMVIAPLTTRSNDQGNSFVGRLCTKNLVNESCYEGGNR